MDDAVDGTVLDALVAHARAWAPMIVDRIPPDAAAALAVLAIADPADPYSGEDGDAAVLQAVCAVDRPLRERLVEARAPLAVEVGDAPVAAAAALLTDPQQSFAIVSILPVDTVVEAVQFLTAMRPGTPSTLRGAVEAVARQAGPAFRAVPSDDGEASILAAHGVAHLGPAVATALPVLAGPVLGTDDRERTTTAAIGTAVGLALLALRAAPEPAGYRAAVSARERSEYVSPSRAVHGQVRVSGHLFALTEGTFPAGEIDVSGTGLAAAVPGGVVVRTGTADGWVHVTVDVQEQEPPDEADVPEEVVELSYRAEAGFASVLGAGGTVAEGLRHVTPPRAGDYRVRVRAGNRDAGDAGSRRKQESYWLSLWPAAAKLPVVRRRADLLGYRLRGEPEPVRAERPELDGFEELFVSYHQLVVGGDWNGAGLGLYTVGGRLLHVTGPSEVTVMTGPHTGTVHVRALGLRADPGTDRSGWDAVEQATVWAPEGRISVCGLMSEPLESDPDLAVAGPGLYRLEVRARHRRPDDVEAAEDDPAEAYELLTWPVTEDAGHVTIRVDDLPQPDWDPKPARAAQLAMLAVLTGHCADPFDPNAPVRSLVTPDVTEHVPRARVIRSLPVPATPDQALAAARAALGGDRGGVHVVPVGPLQVTLAARPTPDADPATETWTWAWSWAGGAPPDPEDDNQAWAAQLAVPDPAPSMVQLRAVGTGSGDTELTVVHDGVLAGHAVPLGLVWEHLLARAAASLRHPGSISGSDADAWPWQGLLVRFAEQDRRQRAEARQREKDRERQDFGGRPLTPRLRNLRASVQPVANLDRDLLDALADASPDRQRDVAVWTARRACTVARLVEVAWIADALRALDRGDPLPAAFHDVQQVWDRLLTDPDVPHTLVTSPSGHPNALQQAMAFPALLAMANPDPLAAAVDALHAAAIAYGPDWPQMLQQARRDFPELATS